MQTQKAHKNEAKKQELEALILKANRYFESDGGNKRISLYKKILQISKEIDAEREYGLGLSFLTRYYLNMRQFNAALESITECLVISKKLNELEWFPRLYNWSGYIHRAKGDYSNAIDFYQLEIDTHIALNREQNCFIAYSVMGNIYGDLDNKALAESYYVKAQKLAAKYPENGDIINNTPFLNTSLIDFLSDGERYSEAKKLCYETLEFVEKHPSVSKTIVPFIYSALSLINYDTKNFSDGIKYAFKAEKYAINNHKQVAFNLCRLKAYNYIGLKEYEKAAFNLRKGLKLLPKVEGIYLVKIEMLQKAISLFDSIKARKDASNTQSLLDKVEVEYLTLQTKLKSRTKSLADIETSNTALPENKKQIELQTVHNGYLKFNIETICACYTQSEADKNVSKILASSHKEEIKVRRTLNNLYDTIGNENFVWISRSAFINKTHIKDWEAVAQKGKINVQGKVFEISRRKRKELFNNHNKNQQA